MVTAFAEIRVLPTGRTLFWPQPRRELGRRTTKWFSQYRPVVVLLFGFLLVPWLLAQAQVSVNTILAPYFDPLQGASSNDLIRRALNSNGEIGLRPNPTLDFKQSNGKYIGSAGESETSIGVALPLEVGGQRRRRVELARAELEAIEAEVADRERRLAAEVRSVYVEALAALRELQLTENLNNLDLQR